MQCVPCKDNMWCKQHSHCCCVVLGCPNTVTQCLQWDRNTGQTVSFHIGAFFFDARQFGAFHFGDFHFDAIPVRRVSLWRASTSARFSLARFHFGAFLFGAFPNFVRTYDDPVSANASFARTVSFLRRNAFYASLARISFCVAYLFALMFPICEEVFSTPV